jgi:hypothetical protein
LGKVKITTWVDERTVGVVRGLAAQNGISMSEMCAEMLRTSVADRAGDVGVEVLLPALRGAIRYEVAKMSDRLAHLTSRSAYESAAARRLIFQLLVEEVGEGEANARNRAAWKASVESLRKPVEGLREILEEASPLRTPEDGSSGVEQETAS